MEIENSDRKSVFPFFLGCGRSGTTLLRAMFDSHPEVAIPEESYFVTSMGSNMRRYQGGQGFAAERFVSDLLVQPLFREWGLPDDTIRHAFQSVPPQTFADAVRCVFASYAAHHAKPRYGDKTPTYVLAMPWLARLFPEARFVHLIRDGREVALSLMETPRGPKDVPAAVLYWKRHVVRGRQDGSRLGPELYREVHYEELITNTEDTLKSLCGFLEIEFNSVMLRYFERAEEVLQGFPDGERHRHRHLFSRPTIGLRDWRRQISKDDLAIVDALVGKLLGDLGYERDTERRSTRVWLAARKREVTEEARGVVRHSVRKVVGWSDVSWNST